MTELPLNPPDSKRALPSWLRFLYSGEDRLLALVLAAMMILPLAELVLRKVANVGITGSSSFVQHLTLLVGMLGGALAAREAMADAEVGFGPKVQIGSVTEQIGRERHGAR